MITLVIIMLLVALLVSVPFILSSRQLSLSQRKRTALAQAARARAALAERWESASLGRAATDKSPAPRGYSRKDITQHHEQ